MNEYTECESCLGNYNSTEDGSCDDCVDGRYIGEVCGYASTCDSCGELTGHESMRMDLENQLGYCEICLSKNIALRHTVES